MQRTASETICNEVSELLSDHTYNASVAKQIEEISIIKIIENIIDFIFMFFLLILYNYIPYNLIIF